MELKFNEQIKNLRSQNRITQQELADKIGVSLMSVRRWEWGEQEPRALELSKIAEIFGVTTDELINGSDNRVIEVSLKFAADLDMRQEVIDMTGAKGFALTMTDDGFLGIAGAAKIETREQLEAAFGIIKQRLEEGFAFQVSRGISREA